MQRSVDDLVALWIAAKSASSPYTWRRYTDVMREFRTWLHERGLDLDHPDTFRLAEEIRSWAGNDTSARATYNHRLGVLSSFYQYVRRHLLLRCDNPADLLDRIHIPPYPNAKAVDFGEIQRRLVAIDRSTLHGKRDFAFLVIALTTGRRKSELMQLRMGDLEWGDDRLTLIWRRCKGGKVMRDTLATFPRQVLLEYLHALYGTNLAPIAPDAAVWASIARHNYGKPLGSSSMSRICSENLEITSIHRLRHTFARAMEEAGAKVTDIQERLGHNNLFTTSIYLSALRRDVNPHADALAALFGIQDILAEPTPEPGPMSCVICGREFDERAQADPRRRFCSRDCVRISRRKQWQSALQQAQHAPQDECVEPQPPVVPHVQHAPRKNPASSAEAVTTTPNDVPLQQLPLWDL